MLATESERNAYAQTVHNTNAANIVAKKFAERQSAAVIVPDATDIRRTYAEVRLDGGSLAFYWPPIGNISKQVRVPDDATPQRVGEIVFNLLQTREGMEG